MNWAEIVLVGLTGMFACLITLEVHRAFVKRRQDAWHKRALDNRAKRKQEEH